MFVFDDLQVAFSQNLVRYRFFLCLLLLLTQILHFDIFILSTTTFIAIILVVVVLVSVAVRNPCLSSHFDQRGRSGQHLLVIRSPVEVVQNAAIGLITCAVRKHTSLKKSLFSVLDLPTTLRENPLKVLHHISLLFVV